MPWSPLKYTEEIFHDLKRRGYETEATTQELHVSIMKATQLIRSATIKNVVHAFMQLGYVKQKANGVWEINYWKTDQSKATEAREEAEQEVAKLEEDLAEANYGKEMAEAKTEMM